MKAKIIKTGEVVEVYHEPQHGQTSNIYKEAVLLNGRMWTEDELDFSINLDLEKEVEFYWKQCDLTWCKDAYTMTHIRAMLSDIAEHFYELGMQVSNKAQKEE